MEIATDLKEWHVLSCPVTGLRFDVRTLELMDANHDGRIRSDEVLTALEFLKAHGVSPEALDKPDAADAKRLDEVLARTAALDALEPSELEKAAFAAWEAEGPRVAVCGAATEKADAALAVVEPVIDGFFAVPDDLPLVTDVPDAVLPLDGRLNPKYAESIFAFAEACVTPVLGVRTTLTRMDWTRVKAAFAPYRAWCAAKPVLKADARAELETEERLLRYRLYLGSFLRNFATMDALYTKGDQAIFLTGVLRIDGKELRLCFHVADEGAHAALSGKSNCCVVYYHLMRPGDSAEANGCAVVTAGAVRGLYPGRNGVFYDRDGRNWEATITRVVENQVSLAEAFWSPWRKIGEGVAAAVRKFLGDRQAKATGDVQKGTASAQAGGAAMASAVAAVGIGMGMAGAAVASVAAVVRGMSPLQIAIAVAALVALVSLPSVVLAWFKLRRRDLGAILNAGGWAVNRAMPVSSRMARRFTVRRVRFHLFGASKGC